MGVGVGVGGWLGVGVSGLKFGHASSLLSEASVEQSIKN